MNPFRSGMTQALTVTIAASLGSPVLAAATPETRPLTEREAAEALERDWLFQAMGEPLLERAVKEIGWAREIAARRTRAHPSLDLAPEFRELEALRERLEALRAAAPAVSPSEAVSAVPAWIWYPEGRPAEDAPAASRYFRRRFVVPAGVRAAAVRVAADDACEVFLDGVRLGSHETWGRGSTFPAAALRPGENVLAVRAENRPAPSKNPAGLIARLTATLDGGRAMAVVSDGDWRSAMEATAGWEQPGFDDAGWKSVAVVAPLGGGPWGRGAMDGSGVEDDPVAAYAGTDEAVRDAYLAVRRIKRRIFFRNPALDFDQVVLIDQPLPQGPESIHEAIHRMGIMAVPGGRLLVLDGLHPGGGLRVLAPEDGEDGSFWRPDLSFDGRRVLYCYKGATEKSFHLHEVSLDGSGRRRLTDSEYDDIDPLYLPDGHILFTTTRGNSYVRCGPFIYSYILARCDADGGNVYLISYNGEPDFVPALLEDGRVIYSRWEYTDKPLWRLQKLWTTNQDGTGTAHFWGNQSVWPDHTSEPRPIPNGRRVMFSGAAHHDWWSASIGIIDPDEGRDYPHGLTKVTADLPWPEVPPPPEDRPEAADYHPSGRFTGYKSPYPLSDEDFLVSARGLGGKFRLYLMDVHGNRDLIYDGAFHAWHAIPVRPRPAPPLHADRVSWPGTGEGRRPVEPGIFFSADVHEGVPEIPRGSAKWLRVFQLDYKTYSTWNKTYRNSGPPVSIVQEEGVKRILSEVPVEADGSVHFEAPAGRALYFQLLDEDRRSIQTMRSFTGLMPGERRGCTGCHEGRGDASPRRGGIAARRPPTPLSPPPWGTESIGFERFVQPVLDRYCVECHRGVAPGDAGPNLASRPGAGVFKEPYLTLVGAAGWGNPAPGGGPGYGIAGAIPVESAWGQSDPRALVTLPPGEYLSRKSRLIDLASSGEHHDVMVDPMSLRRLIAWVDACAPYLGDEELRMQGDPDFPGIERLPIRPRVATAPVVERP